jgi:serine protease SohB
MRNFIPFLKRPPLVPVIRLQGSIGTGRGSLSDAGRIGGAIQPDRRADPAVGG